MYAKMFINSFISIVRSSFETFNLEDTKLSLQPLLGNYSHGLVLLAFHNIAHDASLLLLFRLAADILEHLVHFLKCFARGFRHNEKCENEGEQTKDGEEGVGSKASVLDERRSYKTLVRVSCGLYQS